MWTQMYAVHMILYIFTNYYVHQCWYVAAEIQHSVLVCDGQGRLKKAAMDITIRPLTLIMNADQRLF